MEEIWHRATVTAMNGAIGPGWIIETMYKDDMYRLRKPTVHQPAIVVGILGMAPFLILLHVYYKRWHVEHAKRRASGYYDNLPRLKNPGDEKEEEEEEEEGRDVELQSLDENGSSQQESGQESGSSRKSSETQFGSNVADAGSNAHEME